MRWPCLLLLAGCETFFPLDPPPPAWRLQATAMDNAGSMLGLGRSTTAGSLLIVAVEYSPSVTITSMTDDVGDELQPVTGSIAKRDNSTVVEIWYAANLHEGGSRVTATFGSGSEVSGIVAWQVEFEDPSPQVVDDIAITNEQSGRRIVGPAVETSRVGAFVVSATLAGNVEGVAPDSEFTNDATVNGNAYAHLTSAQAPAGLHHAEWDQLNDEGYGVTAVAFAPGD